MSPEDKDEIQAIVCRVELDLRTQEQHDQRRLMWLELALLPIAIVLVILWPLPAGGIVLIPNLVLRGYQLRHSGGHR